ncbi:MAG: hypothetical protein GC190_22160 [Alphaproteobacteria bacterium]|nr:hypothetical protein [Alphaproteobacteria bacterium]
MSRSYRHFALAVASASSFALIQFAWAAGTTAIESVSEAKAEQVLGKRWTGTNWKVESPVYRDGFMHNFTLETPYGKYQVSGDKLLAQRLAELQAVDTLEKMSKSKAFVDAAKNAGLAPLRFGRDLVTAPIETTDRLVSGVAHMFDRVGDEIENRSASRDPFLDSAVGIQKAKRELAFSLGVDPYSDFPPLAEGLSGVAQMMALGDISISAAYSAIPGGAGIAVSSTSTAATLSEPLRDKSSAEIAATVRAQLEALQVSDDEIKAFFKNTNYSPADQLAIADALTTLHIKDSTVFIERATRAENTDVAKFQRYRVELMAKENARLGLESFAALSGFAINRDKAGNFVAVFPFDEVLWTQITSRSFGELTDVLAKQSGDAKPVFATTARVSATAEAQIKKLGWQIVKL